MTNVTWDLSKGLPRTSIMALSDFTVLAEGLDHPECVAVGPNGEIYAGGEAGQIYRIENGQPIEIGNTGGFVLGLALDARSNVYACDLREGEVLKITPDGVISVYSNGSSERRMVNPNYLVFDADGHLYVSDSGRWNGNDGCIFKIAPDGVTDICTTATPAFPNGMALHPDLTHLYVVESQTPSVVRLPFLSDGSLGQPELVIELPYNIPDGLAFDEDRSLYISCYSPSVIYRVNFDGEVAVLVSDWESTALATPTNIAFAGADRDQLVVASISRWHLATTKMPVKGARLFFPDLD